MITLDSTCSGLDSTSMDENNSNNSTTKRVRHNDDIGGSTDVALWGKFSNNFQQVQSVLDKNRVLIQQVNENHQSKLPDNLTKNVGLIREINSNISAIVSLYSNLSQNFADVFRDGGGVAKNKNRRRE